MIDEKKLIEEIKKMFVSLTTADGSAEVDVCIHSYDEALYDVLNIIQELPIEDEWIPVEERMPNYLQKVLVTYIGYFDEKRHCDEVAYYDYSGQWMWALDDTRVGVEIIAWMPLPEPYHCPVCGGKISATEYVCNEGICDNCWEKEHSEFEIYNWGEDDE